MSDPDKSALEFADDQDVPVPYMARTRAWYLALGYDNPYRWAHYADVPFMPLAKPLSDCVVGLITTASPFDPAKGEQGPGAPYNARAKFYEVYSGDTSVDHDLRIAHVAIDRKHTSMTDSGSWFPLPLLRELVAQGKIGKLAPRFHGAPTNRSQRHTLVVDCPELLRRCQSDGVDAVVLVANCPVCHQTLSLVARHLEANGISTVLMGCAKDVVEHCGVPRFLFSDFPLGNAAGKPHDIASQRQTLGLALELLAAAPAGRTTVQSPQRWSESSEWKLDYSNPDRVSEEELARLRAEADSAKSEIARQKALLA
ncbi:MAG: reductase [Burkholderiaceae bacterium]|nr:reductase [Burkholderiaceae bacterium]MCD8516169.1 reductase [Burkholderiaceae bacterium]MCD8536700.1 reductase [Burkholderiaceae bacterium]MCD8566177.1 reductase [Burkholderiaceae bacterium]